MIKILPVGQTGISMIQAFIPCGIFVAQSLHLKERHPKLVSGSLDKTLKVLGDAEIILNQS